MLSKTKKLLAIGFYRPNTGLTRVMQSIVAPLSDFYEVHYIGMGYKGPTIDGPVKIYPCNLEGGDVYGAYQALELIKELKPELVFLLNDIWILKNYMRVLSQFEGKIRVVAYVPLDGCLPNNDLLLPLTAIDRLVVYTEFARCEIASLITKENMPELSFSHVDVIPHGVDTNTFYPLADSVETQLLDRYKAKEAVFRLTDLEDSFIVLNANRPQPRKRIDLSLKGFSLFAKDKPANVKLCLHHAVMSDLEKQEIVTLSQQYGIEDRLILSPVDPIKDTSDEELNLIYNACDVGLNTSMGEGWGLISFEHAATGAAQIVPEHSACKELWQGSAELVKPINSVEPLFSPLRLQEVSVRGVGTALEQLYQNREYLKKMSVAAFKNATQPKYQWLAIAERWNTLFQEELSALN